MRLLASRHEKRFALRCTTALIFSSMFIMTACSSADEAGESQTIAIPEAPEPPAQVSFADWERPLDCEIGTMPVIGEAECQLAGSACPEGDWPAVIPESEQVIYVQPGGEGDGSSADSPLGTIGEAITLAQDDSLILLSKGTHLGNIIVEKAVSILGTCPEGTILQGEVGMGEMVTAVLPSGTMEDPTSETGETLAVVYIRGETSVSIRDLTITGDNVGLFINGEEPLKVVLEGLVLNELIDSSVIIRAGLAEVNAHSLSIRNTRHRADLDNGSGIKIHGGTMLLTRSVLDTNFYGGITCDSAIDDPRYAQLEVSNSIVMNTKPSPVGARLGGIQGYGLSSWRCDMTVNQVLLENNHFYGIGVFNEHELPAILKLDDVIVRGTKSTPELRRSDAFPWAASELGVGAFLFGGEAYLNRVLLEDNTSADILVMESAFPCNVTTIGTCETTYAVLENITSRSVNMDTTGQFGVGFIIMDGAEVLASKVSIDGAHYAGVLVSDALRRNGSGDTMALFTDLSVNSVLPSEVDDISAEGETFGDGIVVGPGALSSFDKFTVSDVARCGVLLAGRYDWNTFESNFTGNGDSETNALESSSTGKAGNPSAVLSRGYISGARVGVNIQMDSHADEIDAVADEIDNVADEIDVVADEIDLISKSVSSDVVTSDTNESESTVQMAIPFFSFLHKEFMEEVFGAVIDGQQ